MANQYPVVNLDKVQSAYAGNIENIVSGSALNNGTFVKLGALKSGYNELYEIEVATTPTVDYVLLVASDEVVYARYNSDGTIVNRGDFTNLPNRPAKAYHLTEGDYFSITDDGFDGSAVVGKYLITQAGSTKGVIADNLSGNTRFAAEVVKTGITSLTYEGDSATRFRVVKV